MRVCVTGGAGFIGSHLVDALVKHGAIVSVIDDLCNGSLENLRQSRDRVQFILGSILDAAAIDAAVRDCAVVFHQAALGSVPRSIEQPDRYLQVNAMGTLSVLEAVRRIDESSKPMPRVVYAASSSAYGDTPALPKVETMVASPRSPYAAAKYAGELLLQSHCACYGLSGISLRYFNVFGPRQRADSAYAAVIPRFIDALRRGQPPAIYGDGTQSRDFTAVENAVHANLLAGVCERSLSGQSVNIACGQQFTLLQLLDMLQQLMGTSVAPQFEPARPGDVLHSLASIEAASELIGYTCRVELMTGLQRMFSADGQ